MNITKHKPNLAAQMNEHEMPEYKGKWKNISFLRSGGSRLGIKIYDSKEEAKVQAGWCLQGDNVGVMGPSSTTYIPTKSISFIMQIPVAL